MSTSESQRGHFCPECGQWWPCQSYPCDTPPIEPCPVLGCGFGWREAVNEHQQPYPEWEAMARNLYPHQAIPHSEYCPAGFFEWLVWDVFSVVGIARS